MDFSATLLKKEDLVLNRREVLLAGAAASAALVSGCHTRGSRWLVFTDGEARTLAALCDQIIPADGWPSASEAGVVTFIDRQLTGPYRRHRKAYRRGLEDTEKLAASRFGVELAHASAAQQLQITQAIEQQNSTFFELVRRHTLQGYYGSPRHGGNKDAVSWRMLGLAEPPLRGRAQYDFTAEPKA
jgi:gluconate 2-dehydrogenase gamma chain